MQLNVQSARSKITSLPASAVLIKISRCIYETNSSLKAETTLNLLRVSRINLKLSAYAQVHGAFDGNRTPLAPPGIRVIAHIKPNERTTWFPHGANGWYMGPALEAYRCYTVWMWDTRDTCTCNTLKWLPIATSTELTLAGIQDILPALKNPTANSPGAPLTDSHHEILLQMTSLVTSVAKPVPEPLAPIPDPTLRVTNVPPSRSSPIEPPTNPVPALRIPKLIMKVRFGPLPTTTSTATFHNSPGAPGKKRRRSRRLSTPTSAAHPSKTIHPNKLKSTTIVLRPVANHNHGTRSKPLHHVTACARALLLDDARAPQSPCPSGDLHQLYAYLGHAFNPDTGKSAEYRKLSQSSAGPIWMNSNCEKIGR